MKWWRYMGAYVCSLAVLTIVLITPVNGIITLSIPDGDSDTYTWNTDRDHPGKRVGDDPRSAIALITGSILVRNELDTHEVPYFSSESSEPIFRGHVTIRGPP